MEDGLIWILLVTAVEIAVWRWTVREHVERREYDVTVAELRAELVEARRDRIELRERLMSSGDE